MFHNSEKAVDLRVRIMIACGGSVEADILSGSVIISILILPIAIVFKIPATTAKQLRSNKK